MTSIETEKLKEEETLVVGALYKELQTRMKEEELAFLKEAVLSLGYTRTARALKIDRKTLYNNLIKLGVKNKKELKQSIILALDTK